MRLAGVQLTWFTEYIDCNRLPQVRLWYMVRRGYRGGSPTAVQAWRPCPLWELFPSHPLLV